MAVGNGKAISKSEFIRRVLAEMEDPECTEARILAVCRAKAGQEGLQLCFTRADVSYVRSRLRRNLGVDRLTPNIVCKVLGLGRELAEAEAVGEAAADLAAGRLEAMATRDRLRASSAREAESPFAAAGRVLTVAARLLRDAGGVSAARDAVDLVAKIMEVR